MHLLITNDDGIEAEGLAALVRAAAPFGTTLVLAPDQCHSGCSHKATTERPLRLTPLSGGRHMLDGTPTDCTRVGLTHLFPQVDWVIAGINHGGNLGADVYLSGTVAAVREAVLLGKPGIAVSQYRRRGVMPDWDRAAEWTQHVLGVLLERMPVAGRFWNVNLPCCDADEDQVGHTTTQHPELVFCPLDPHPLPVEFRQQDDGLHYAGNYHQRLRQPGSDVEVCFSGRIAITQLALP